MQLEDEVVQKATQAWLKRLSKRFAKNPPTDEIDLRNRGLIELQNQIIFMLKDYGKIGDISLASRIIQTVDDFLLGTAEPAYKELKQKCYHLMEARVIRN